MRTPTTPALKPGKVYRTADLRRWGKNPTRLARRLEEAGRLRPLPVQGLYFCPRRTRFGPVPPSDEEVLAAFLKGSPYVFSGPSQWNRLGLNTTAVFPDTWVYNTRRTCTLPVGKRRLRLRRVRFPRRPTPEWFVVDLLENRAAAGVSLPDLEEALRAALAGGRFDRDRLRKAAAEFGTREVRDAVERAVSTAARP